MKGIELIYIHVLTNKKHVIFVKRQKTETATISKDILSAFFGTNF